MLKGSIFEYPVQEPPDAPLPRLTANRVEGLREDPAGKDDAPLLRREGFTSTAGTSASPAHKAKPSFWAKASTSFFVWTEDGMLMVSPVRLVEEKVFSIGSGSYSPKGFFLNPQRLQTP